MSDRDRIEMVDADLAASGKERRIGLAVAKATARVFWCPCCGKMIGMEAPTSRAPKCDECGRWMVPSGKPRLIRLSDDGVGVDVIDDYQHPGWTGRRFRTLGVAR